MGFWESDDSADLQAVELKLLVQLAKLSKANTNKTRTLMYKSEMTLMQELFWSTEYKYFTKKEY